MQDGWSTSHPGVSSCIHSHVPGDIALLQNARRRKTMNDPFSSRIPRMAVAVLLAVVLIGVAAIANAAEPKLDDDWHFTLIPYLWLPSINGKMNINLPHGSGSNDFKVSGSSLLSNLTFGAMLTMEVEKGNWSLLTDIMYMDLSGSDTKVTFPNLPGGGLDISAEAGFKALIIEGGPAYSLYRSQDIRFDFLAGIRYIGLDSNVTLNASTPLPVTIPSRDFSYKKDLVDPIVGIKGRFELGKGWFIPYYFDAGGFGINNEWSWQAYGGVGYHFSKLFSMNLGYRHLQYYFDNNKLLKDVYMSGPQLGFVFRF
jgi:opacity protein-like surface antigen